MESILISVMALILIYSVPLSIVSLILVIQALGRISRLEKENRALRQGLPQTAAPVAPKPAAPTPVAPAVPKTEPKVAPPPPPAPAKEKKPRNVESLLGKNVLAMAATTLIFVGIIAFGVLAFSKITDPVKALGLFLASFLLTGVGIFLFRKNQNPFTEILSGCGMGAVYISILITHLYFNLLNDLAAFGLILLWGAGLLLVTRFLKIRSAIYIAHFGCLLSTVLSAGYGATSEKYIEITVYQLVTFALLFFANRKKKWLHTVSCLLSMILNTVLAGVVMDGLGSDVYKAATNPVLLSLFAALCLYNCGLFILALRSSRFASTGRQILIYITFAFALLQGGFSTLYNHLWELFPNNEITVLQEYSISLAWVGILLAGILLALWGTPKKTRIPALLFAQGVAATLLLIAAGDVASVENGRALPFTLVFALICFGLAYWHKKKEERNLFNLYWAFGLAYFLIDAIATDIFLFDFPWLGVPYSLLLLAVSLFALWLKTGNCLSFPLLQLAVLDLHLVFTLGNLLDAQANLSVMQTFFLVTAGNIALYLCFLWQKKKSSEADIFLEIGESIWIFVMSLILVAEQAPLDPATVPISWDDLWLLLLSFLLLSGGMLRFPKAMELKNPAYLVWHAVKFTYLTLVPIGQFTTLFEEQFLLSVAFMVVAVLFILLGFWKNRKPLRLYGLVLILASVLKMVVADVWNQDSIIRVVSLIGGGTICFAISATYNYVEKKRIAANALPEEHNENTPTP